MLRIIVLKFLDRWLGAALAAILPGPSPAMRSNRPRSVLLIRPGGIGDALLLVPAVQILQESFRQIEIDILAERRNADAFALCPGLRHVYHYDLPSHLLRVLSTRYDVVIDTEQWHRLSSVVARVVRAPVKIGFATNRRRRMFTHPVSYQIEDYEVVSFKNLLSPLGIEVKEPSGGVWLKVPDSARQSVSSRLPAKLDVPVAVIFPGASIPEKQWGHERFRMLAQWFGRQNLSVVVVGGGEERVAGDSIVEGIAQAINLAGRTSLVETAAVLERAVVVVSGDSGVLHLAAGLGRPLVALFGPSDPRKWGPRGDRQIILQTAQACSPCSKFGYTPTCSQNVRCLAELTPTSVIAAIDDLLSLTLDRES